ncbi:hypothetical protein LIER_15756 [Lithospermum erythrorhizon]|uniref:Uncharacterized protein n=1 Tax=Lithospermum erythrorhizon TaxID=34254 RepID=A0AAV3Q5J9_LITER
MPVYEPGGGQCIGVFELVSCGYSAISIEENFRDMSALFQVQHYLFFILLVILQSSNLRLKEWPSSFTGVSDALVGFDKALGHVCNCGKPAGQQILLFTLLLNKNGTTKTGKTYPLGNVNHASVET